MENEYSGPSSQSVALIINPQIEGFLTETIKWGKFLSILGFVFTGIIALVGILALISPSIGLTNQFTASFGLIVGPIYLLMSLLYFFPSRFLYKFSGNIKKALLNNDQETLTLGFENLKSNFKFWGILSLIMVITYGVAIAGAIIFNLFLLAK